MVVNVLPILLLLSGSEGVTVVDQEANLEECLVGLLARTLLQVGLVGPKAVKLLKGDWVENNRTDLVLV